MGAQPTEELIARRYHFTVAKPGFKPFFISPSFTDGEACRLSAVAWKHSGFEVTRYADGRPVDGAQAVLKIF